MLIAIDGSTVKTGYAFGAEKDGAPKGGVWDLPGADEIVFDRTLGLLCESLRLLVRTVGAKRVVIEKFITPEEGSNSHTIVSLIQVVGCLRGAANAAGCIVTLVPASTVRRHFIGTGNLKRDPAKKAVMERNRLLGWTYKDDNQADANATWCWGMSKFYPSWAPNGTPLFRKASGGD